MAFSRSYNLAQHRRTHGGGDSPYPPEYSAFQPGRIRKVSSEDGGLKSTRRFEAVRAGLVEGEANSIAGGMI